MQLKRLLQYASENYRASIKKKKKPNTTHSITAFGYGSSENTLIITVVMS